MKSSVLVGAFVAFGVFGAFAVRPTPAHAKPMVPRGVSISCASGPSWDALKKCLERFGHVTIEKTIDGVGRSPRVKVVRLSGAATEYATPGFYLYAERGAGLRLVGAFQVSAGADFELLDLSKLEIRGHAGVRLEVGSTEDAAVLIDDETSVPAIMQRKTAVFCVGPDSYCPATIESCDLFVQGKAFHTFRGVVTVSGGAVTVTGDRSRAGMCAPAETTPIVDGGDPR